MRKADGLDLPELAVVAEVQLRANLFLFRHAGLGDSVRGHYIQSDEG